MELLEILKNLPHVKVPFDPAYPFLSGAICGVVIVWTIITIYYFMK